MKVNIYKLDYFGRGITYLDEKICFINNAFPNEIVEINITNEKSKYKEGEVKEVVEKSPYRIKSECPFSNKCGGCTFQKYDYNEENKYKENKIREQVKNRLKINDNIVKNIVYSDKEYYRNKLVLHGNKKDLGQYQNKTNEIVDIDNCIISNKKINEIIKALRNYKEIEEVLIRTSNDLKEVLIDIKGNINDYEELLNICDVLIINDKVITKKDSIITNIGSKKYYLSSKSFFQVNKDLTENLFDKVKEYIKEIKPNKLLDLYCGTGSIGIYVSDYAKEIVGIDYNKSNIENAKNNVLLNNLNNINFICDKVENRIDEFTDFDVVIVDPPRKGLDNHTCKYLLQMKPKSIIYVSCDINTLIRDLELLRKEYDIKEITPYNLFPRTYHCESVCILERR